MNDLTSLRKEIDTIDTELLHLFASRMDIVEKVANYKKQNAIPIRNKLREEEVIKQKALECREDIQREVIAFFSSIMEISRSFQRRLIEEAENPDFLPAETL